MIRYICIRACIRACILRSITSVRRVRACVSARSQAGTRSPACAHAFKRARMQAGRQAGTPPLLKAHARAWQRVNARVHARPCAVCARGHAWLQSP